MQRPSRVKPKLLRDKSSTKARRQVYVSGQQPSPISVKRCIVFEGKLNRPNFSTRTFRFNLLLDARVY